MKYMGDIMSSVPALNGDGLRKSGRMKICHLGNYGKNIGDNAALYNIRQFYPKSIEWISCDLGKFHERRNDFGLVSAMIKELNSTCDAFLIGGGGMIQGGVCNRLLTGWNLPFNEKTLALIDKPIICFGLGVNLFRGMPGLSEVGVANLRLLIEKSALFSVRNDGSRETLEKYIPINQIIDKVLEVPDPGLIFASQKDRKSVVKKGFFQPAKNGHPKINKHRNMSDDTRVFLERFCIDNSLISMPHTSKDFNFFINKMGAKDLVKNWREFKPWLHLLSEERYLDSLGCYRELDYCVAMRGHGQLISCGLNVPSISLSTQDKVFDFAMKNGYKDYVVDTYDQNDWKKILIEKTKALRNSKNYLSEWYDINEANLKIWRKEFLEFVDATKVTLCIND